MSETAPKIIDNDFGTIAAVLDGAEIRSWEYANSAEHRQKMLMAREYAEGWYSAHKSIRAQRDGLLAALKRIAGMKPDRLDHSLDVLIIERAAKIVRAAIAEAEKQT